MYVDNIVIKVASRCNLNCSYCYVYNLGDKSYLSRPKLMSYECAEKIIDQVVSHCVKHNLSKFLFIFHGGEPMLQKKEFFKYFVEKANFALNSIDVIGSFTMQTNGLLIDEDWCYLFNNLEIDIGISLDGYKEINDKYRVDHKNKGSYDRIIQGLLISQQNMKEKPGILSVIDPTSDPIRFYETIKGLDVKTFDLLWPIVSQDLNFEGNPWPSDYDRKQTIYTDWLIKIFDIWYDEKHTTNISITIFDTIIGLILGNEKFSGEDFGSGDLGTLVIETNGDIESVGSLKICGNGFTASGVNIENTTFDEAFETPLAKLYGKSHTYLSKKCSSCPLVEVCGGGAIHTRYSDKNGFDNESVLCYDYAKLIVHIQNAIFYSLPKKYQKEFTAIDYESVITFLEEFDEIEVENKNNNISNVY